MRSASIRAASASLAAGDCSAEVAQDLLALIRKRFEGGQWVAAICAALDWADGQTQQPSVIIADTVKGKGVSFVEADYHWHGKALSPEQADHAREEIQCQ